MELFIRKPRDLILHYVFFVATGHFSTLSSRHHIIEKAILVHYGFEQIRKAFIQRSKAQNIRITSSFGCCKPHLFEIRTDVADKYIFFTKMHNTF